MSNNNSLDLNVEMTQRQDGEILSVTKMSVEYPALPNAQANEINIAYTGAIVNAVLGSAGDIAKAKAEA